MSTKKHFLTVKDNSVSKETFELLYDENLDMLITSPQPGENSIYHKADGAKGHPENHAVEAFLPAFVGPGRRRFVDAGPQSRPRGDEGTFGIVL